MVLLFTHKGDVHPSNVLDILEGWGVSMFRVNTEALISDYNFSWWSTDEGCDFFIENRVSKLRIYGSQITAIWDRRYAVPSELRSETGNEAVDDYKLEEAKAFLDFLRYYLKDIYSIGSIVNDTVVESKLLQMTVARRLGMRVPNTCVSNIKDELCGRLYDKEQLCLKPLSGGNVVDRHNNKEYSLYTQRIQHSTLRQVTQEVFAETANCVQEYIAKKYELRVTVCCEDVITCRILSQHLPDDRGKVDWREGYDSGLGVEVIDTPDKIRDFCLHFLKALNINFGCFDFIVTDEDKIIFLECNPNGQWLWIEEMAKVDISTVIAKNLARYEDVYI